MTKIANDGQVTIGVVVVWAILSVTRVTETTFTRVMLSVNDQTPFRIRHTNGTCSRKLGRKHNHRNGCQT